MTIWITPSSDLWKQWYWEHKEWKRRTEVPVSDILGWFWNIHTTFYCFQSESKQTLFPALMVLIFQKDSDKPQRGAVPCTLSMLCQLNPHYHHLCSKTAHLGPGSCSKQDAYRKCLAEATVGWTSSCSWLLMICICDLLLGFQTCYGSAPSGPALVPQVHSTSNPE